MKKEHNYTSPPTSKIIASLGIKWKASAYWQFVPGRKIHILKDKLEPFKTGVPAYNLTELGHMIPFGFFNQMRVLKLATTYFQVELGTDNWQTYSSEAEARAHYLIHLIRSGECNLVDSHKPVERVEISRALPIPNKP